MKMISPMMIQYLGLIFDDELKGQLFELYFITDYWETSLAYFISSIKWKVIKEIPDGVFGLVYRLTYLLNTLNKTGIPVCYLSPQNIYITESGYPRLFLPIFSNSVVSSRNHLQS